MNMNSKIEGGIESGNVIVKILTSNATSITLPTEPRFGGKVVQPRTKTIKALAEHGLAMSIDILNDGDPHRILLDAEVGLQRAECVKGEDYVAMVDRAEAIHRAIALAKPGDLVMIAGKGHEDYQILGTERIHFDDREVARAALEARVT